jgi:hypothetical protein
MNPLLHKLKRFLQKSTIKVIRLSTPPQDKSEYERDAVNICKKLILKQDTTLLLTPLSGKRYIKNDDLGISVILEGRNIKVINHIYSYTVFLEDKSWLKVVSIFDLEVERRREIFEKEITENIKHSLQTIYKSI